MLCVLSEKCFVNVYDKVLFKIKYFIKLCFERILFIFFCGNFCFVDNLNVLFMLFVLLFMLKRIG